MKIRAQLVLACFLLSIVPLGAIVAYSYYSSRGALERTYKAEAARATRQMDHRLAAIRGDLQQKLAELTALTLPAAQEKGAAGRHVTNDILVTLGDSAPLIDSLELQPMPPTPPGEIIASGRTPAAHKASETDAAAEAAPATPAAPSHAAAAAPAPPVPPVPPVATPGLPSRRAEGFVINIPEFSEFPAFGMSAEQRTRLHEIGRISRQLSAGEAMTSEERMQLEQKLAAIQAEFSREQAKSNEELKRSLRAAAQLRDGTIRRNLAELKRRAGKDATVRGADDVPAGTTDGDTTVADGDTGGEELPVHTPAHVSIAAGEPAASPAPDPRKQFIVKRIVSPEQVAHLDDMQKRSALVFGKELKIPVRRDGAVVANLSAHVRLEEVLRRVLGTGTEDGEIAFAVDHDGNVYTRSPQERATLDRLGITKALSENRPLPKREEWVVSMSNDPESGVRVGVARPVGNDLGDLRRAAGVNFSAGIALILVALAGIVPVANHITRDVKLVTAGAERIAHGDLTTRVPIHSRNEFGQLATAFNKMAADLSQNQQTILEQERSRREQELQQKMLEMEYARKSVDLEEARRFQLSMLPKELPESDAFDIAVLTETATEVGGDYYDFHVAGGKLTAALGDATGHGAKAGTMITVAKTLFASYSGEVAPAAFLTAAAEKIKRMEFTRMAMSLLLAQFEPGRMTIAAAGMPPALVWRAASGAIEEIAVSSTPLGTLGSDYADRVVKLAAGDVVLLLTDGFPELQNGEGQQLGYGAAAEAFKSACSAATAAGVIASLAAAAHDWRGAAAPNDDVTFVVLMAR